MLIRKTTIAAVLFIALAGVVWLYSVSIEKQGGSQAKQEGSQIYDPYFITLTPSWSNINNQRYPAIVLSTEEPGIDAMPPSGSPFKINKVYTQGSLLINVVGASTDNPMSNKIDIDLTWLRIGSTKEIVVMLRNEESRFKVNREDRYRVIFEVLSKKNVRVDWVSDRTKKHLITLYPRDILEMSATSASRGGGGSLEGEFYGKNFDPNKDYRPLLVDYAKIRGFVPAKMIYPDIPESTQLNMIYVVATSKSLPAVNLEKLGDGDLIDFLGELPNENVNVALNIFYPSLSILD